MKEQLEDYREGAIGALLDEHENVIEDFIQLVGIISQEEYVTIVDRNSEDDNCRSIQTICTHVVKAGYGYTNMIRRGLGQEQVRKLDGSIEFVGDVPNEIATMIDYMIVTTEPLDQYRYSPEDLMLKSSAGILNMDLLLEHSICHILRHRRQIEKFIIQIRKS